MTSSGVLVYCSLLHRELPTLPPSTLTPEPGESSLAQHGAHEQVSLEEASSELDLDPAGVADPLRGEAVAAEEDELDANLAAEGQDIRASGTKHARRGSRALPSRGDSGMLALWALLVSVLFGLSALAWSRGESPLSELVLTAVVVLWGLAGQRIFATLSQTSERERAELGARLGSRARRVRDSEVSWISVRALRPGESVIVEALEHAPCDGVVLSGEGSALLFPEATAPAVVEPGLRVSAGTRLLSGTMQVVCTAAGTDRTFEALHAGQRSRESLLVRVSRSVRQTVAPLVATLGFVIGFWLSDSWQTGLLVAVANFAALASPLAERLITALQEAWLLLLARQGVDFGADGFDAAGHVQLAVFCARGTFLSGEPEVTDIVGLGGVSEREVLALAAGAESVAAHPSAASIRRAAHDRHFSPEPTRGHDVLGGMGVTCYSADGHRVLVGTRELMMKEKVSIALSEEALRKMEQRGRSGILVAKAGRLIGILALHDALRRGARAAVQLLLDVHIEPVLLSGEARNATEALGRALSIEHVRPEVPARERAAEIRRVIEGGAAVAVVGHSPLDDSALSAASVPIVLDGSALTPRPRCVTLLGDDVLTAAHALVAAQITRRDGLVALVLALAPALLGVLCTSSLLFPPVMAPLAALLGGAAAALWVWSRLERALRFHRKLPGAGEAH